MQKIVLVTGGFDPVHSGHIRYFKAAKELGDYLIVGLNSDAWLSRKKGRSFMPIQERGAILNEFRCIDKVVCYDDQYDIDNSSKNFIKDILINYPDAEIIFANGGDRTKENIPEMEISDPRLKFVFGIGGDDKANSSSWILEEWKAPKTERAWGYYRVLHENGNEVKLKELTVEPGKSLSMQRHNDRAEHWFVAEGRATVYGINVKSDFEVTGIFEKFQHVHIRRTEWHQLANETNEPLKIIEIQYGNNCIEEDIERK